MSRKRLAKKRKLPQKDASTEGEKKSKNGTHKQNGRKSSENNNANLNKIFARVAVRRQKEIAFLKPALVRALLEEIRKKTGNDLASLVAAKSLETLNTKRAAGEVRKWLSSEYKTIANEDTDPDKRRTSWETVNAIFRMIDTFLSKDGGRDDESDTNGHVATQNKASASASASTAGKAKAAAASERSTLINGNKMAEQAPQSTSQAPAKATGKTNTSGDGKKAASASRAATQSSATTTKTTTSTAQKPATTTTAKEATSANSTAESFSKTTAPSNSTTQKNIPARTLASLSSASAMTTATALDSNNPAITANDNKKDPPTGVFAPRFPFPSAAPPAYEKRSLTTVQHKNQKLQKQQQQNGQKGTAQNNSNKNVGGAAKKGTVAPATIAPSSSTAPSNLNSATVASSSTPATTPSLSSSNTNGNVNKAKSNISTTIPEVKEVPIDTKKTENISLPQDPMSVNNTTMYGNFVRARPSVELQFKRFDPISKMLHNCQRRLEKWDPNWVVEKNFCVGVTSPLTSSNYTTQPTYNLHTAARFAVRDLVKYAGPRTRQVQSVSTPPTDMEHRVLIRMLPLYLSKQKDGGRNRADVHLWPKGTYLNIKVPSSHNLAFPQTLSQRKQQSHAPEKWLGICKHLDITSFVHQAYSSTQNSLRADSSESFVQLGCYDQQLYMFSLDLCRYRSPHALYKTLLQSTQLQRVGLDEMQQRAKELMDNNEVVLDSDSEDENHTNAKSSEQKSIRFSIRDPLTLATLKKPVRGRDCKHFSVSENKLVGYKSFRISRSFLLSPLISDFSRFAIFPVL